MLKPIAISKESFAQQARPDAGSEGMAGHVFKIFHGRYGNLFLSKFTTGLLTADGKDAGILSARLVWAYDLQKFDCATVEQALENCKAAHPEYPPSAPQFVALCRACAPRQAFKPEIEALPMGQEVRSRYARQAREINARHEQARIDKKTGFVEIEPGLQGLFAAIANAVANAGGNEAGELRRLNALYAA